MMDLLRCCSSGWGTGSAQRGEPGDELIQALHPLVDTLLHPRSDHLVTVLHRLEDGLGVHQGLAVVLFEGERVQGNVAGRALELEVWTIPSGDGVPW